MCKAVLIGWDTATPPSPRLWAHVRGCYWSAKIDDISLWPPVSAILFQVMITHPTLQQPRTTELAPSTCILRGKSFHYNNVNSQVQIVLYNNNNYSHIHLWYIITKIQRLVSRFHICWLCPGKTLNASGKTLSSHKPKLHSTENSKYLFPEMKLRGLIPNFYIHVSRSDFYIYSHDRSYLESLFPVWHERTLFSTAGLDSSWPFIWSAGNNTWKWLYSPRD